MRETEGLSEVECPGCQGHVALHQPDVRRPDRLLGACESRPAWYLIDAAADLMARLPDLASRGDAPAALMPARCAADLSPGDPAGTPSRSRRCEAPCLERSDKPPDGGEGRAAGSSAAGGPSIPSGGVPQYSSPRPWSGQAGSAPVHSMRRRRT
jgi:hypothetical protein